MEQFVVDSNLQNIFLLVKNMHLNKNRGYAIYQCENMILIAADKNYEKFLVEKNGVYKSYIGEPIENLEQKEIVAYANKALISKTTLTMDNFKYPIKDGKTIFHDLTFIPVIENNRVGYIIESFSDTTELEYNKMQKEFFTYICHEFKTPLTVMLSAIQAITSLCKDELSLKTLKYIKKIKQGSLQQWRLVTNLLDILKSDSDYLKMNKKNLDIVKSTKAITEVVSLYSESKDIKIDFISEYKNLIIAMDEEKFERIILNLLSNAIKFTPKGKHIFVIMGVDKNTVQITVKDTGVGIPEDKFNSIFELFTQLDNSFVREREGSGIGLHLVSQLVRALNGTIQVKSVLNSGSSFILNFPLERVKEEDIGTKLKCLTDNQLVENAKIEFSNVYFD